MLCCIDQLRVEAKVVEAARFEKREVSRKNRESKAEGGKQRMYRVPIDSKNIVGVEIEKSRKLIRRSAQEWLDEINKLPEYLQSKVLHMVFWDYPSKELNRKLTHKIEMVDEYELAVALYMIGYTATTALMRARRAED